MGENVLKNRNYLLLFLGSFVSNLGTAMYNFAISLYVLDLTGSAAFQGLYLMTGGLVFFSLSLFGGAIVDRLDKVKVVYITDLINGLVILSAGLVIFGGIGYTTKIVVLFVCAVILGVNQALFNPAARSLPPHILEENQLQQSSSLNNGMFALYGILGVVFGALMYDHIAIEYIFIANGISFILSGISEFFIDVKTKPEGNHVITMKGTLIDIKEGIGYVLRLKPIFYLVAIASALNFFTMPMIANGFPYLFEIVLQKDAIYLSILNAVFPAGIIISSMILGSQAQKEKVSPLIIKGLFGMGIMIITMIIGLQLLMNGTVDFLVFMIISGVTLLIAGFFNGFVNIPFGVAVMKAVEKEKMGRVFSVISIISNGLTPIAMGLGGIVIEHLGLMIIFYAAGIAIILTAILAKTNKYVNEL